MAHQIETADLPFFVEKEFSLGNYGVAQLGLYSDATYGVHVRIEGSRFAQDIARSLHANPQHFPPAMLRSVRNHNGVLTMHFHERDMPEEWRGKEKEQAQKLSAVCAR